MSKLKWGIQITVGKSQTDGCVGHLLSLLLSQNPENSLTASEQTQAPTSSLEKHSHLCELPVHVPTVSKVSLLNLLEGCYVRDWADGQHLTVTGIDLVFPGYRLFGNSIHRANPLITDQQPPQETKSMPWTSTTLGRNQTMNWEIKAASQRILQRGVIQDILLWLK